MNKTTLRYIAAAGMVVVFLFGCGEKNRKNKIVDSGYKTDTISGNTYADVGESKPIKVKGKIGTETFDASGKISSVYCDTINWKAKYDSLLKRCDNIIFESRIIDTDTSKIILKLN